MPLIQDVYTNFIYWVELLSAYLIYCILNDMTTLTVITKGIGIHGGLFYISNITQIFHIFIFFVSILILQLTSFYPSKVWVPEYSSLNSMYI